MTNKSKINYHDHWQNQGSYSKIMGYSMFGGPMIRLKRFKRSFAPRTGVNLHVVTPAGKPAVKLDMA